MARWNQVFLLVCLTGIFAGGAAMAQDDPVPPKNAHPVFVELYTSQGCSSCVPANKFLASLSQKTGVVALSFAVDYWDYLGWKDTFAKDSFTERQYAYTHSLHERRPFTPQIVINGEMSLPGTQERHIKGAIFGFQAVKTGNWPKLQLRRSGNTLTARVGDGKAPAIGAGVYLATYLPGVSKVVVGEGENKGRTLEQVNMVTSWKKIGDWNGQTESFTVSAPEKGAVVLILQKPGPGKVLGVARETLAPKSTAAIAPKAD